MVERLPSRWAHEGRRSTSDMPEACSTRVELLQRGLYMLILRTFLFGPAHGPQIGNLFKALQLTSAKSSTVALTEHCIGSSVEAEKGRNGKSRRITTGSFKYYR